MEGGAVVLTLKDQNILADGDINEGRNSLVFPSYVSCPKFAKMTKQFCVTEVFGLMWQRLICSKMWKLESRSAGMRLIKLLRKRRVSMMTSKLILQEQVLP